VRSKVTKNKALHSPTAIVGAVRGIIDLPDRATPAPWSQHETVKNGEGGGVGDCGLGWGILGKVARVKRVVLIPPAA